MEQQTGPRNDDKNGLVNRDDRRRDAYAQAEPALKMLRKHRTQLSTQEYKTLKGSALSGDVDGAIRGLKTIMERKE